MVSTSPDFLCHQMNIVFHFFLAISFITQISEANPLFWHHDIDDVFRTFLAQLDRTSQVCIPVGTGDQRTRTRARLTAKI